LLGATPDGWHHYALIWKRSKDDSYEQGNGVYILVNGKIVASTTMTTYSETLSNVSSGIRIVLHDDNSNRSHPIEMCDLKVWNGVRPPLSSEL